MSGQNFDAGCKDYRSVSRRKVVTAGVMGSLGLTLPELMRAEAAAQPKRQLSCILVWLRGGPSSIDMWDLKPDAPSEIRGEFRPIETSVSGIRISEHLPRTAKLAHHFALVRSVTHPRNDHEGGAHVNSSGWDTWPQATYPMYGTVVQKMLGFQTSLPPHICLPEPPMPEGGGKHYLPSQDLPFVATVQNDLDLRVKDLALAGGMPRERFDRRRSLLARTGVASSLGAGLSAGAPVAAANDAFYTRALDVLSTPSARDAFDLTREPSRIRDLYGRADPAVQIVAQGNQGDIAPNEFNRSVVGQGMLMARRLVEAGVRFVTVIGRGWDTHADNFNRLKNLQLPYLDRGISGLIQDLHDRGMLETTLVVVSGDFNRTPQINKDAGRDHWGPVQTIFLAGGGIPGGVVVGASDNQCAYPAERAVSPADIGATILHRFGLRPEMEIVTNQGRPYRLLPDGAEPIRELI